MDLLSGSRIQWWIMCFVFRARPLQCPGAELENVKLLESYNDATKIHQMSAGNKAVIVGTSFIGIQKTKVFCHEHYCKLWHSIINYQEWKWQRIFLTRQPASLLLAAVSFLSSHHWVQILEKWQCRSENVVIFWCFLIYCYTPSITSNSSPPEDAGREKREVLYK